MRPPRRFVGLLAAGLVALASGCTTDEVDQADVPGLPQQGAATAVPERGTATLRVGLGRDPVSLDPRLVADDEGDLVVRALFDGLVDVSPDGAVVPAAATWSISDDGLTYRFVLREDRFHDGTAVTAQHHADALLAVLDPDRAPHFREELLVTLRGALRPAADDEPPLDPGAGPLGPEGAGPTMRWGRTQDVVEAGGIEVVGPRELVLRLARTDPLLLHRLSDPVLVPLPRLATSDPQRFALEPVGNGPFRMLGPREPGEFIRLGRNTSHPSPPRVEALLLQIYAADADRSQRWADVSAGRLQVAAIPPERRDEARERFGSPRLARRGPGLHELPGASVYAYAFAVDVAPFDRSELRRAVSAAIDRETIARELGSAGVEAATAILPPSLGGTFPDCAHCRYDPILARELVDAWRSTLEEGTLEPRITLTYPRGGGHVTVAERIAADVERILGLDVLLQARDPGAFVRAVTGGEVPLFRFGMLAAFGGEAAAVSMLDPALRPGHPDNWSRWADPLTEELLDRWAPGASPDLVREGEWSVLSEGVVVPVLWTRPDLVVGPDVGGFRLDVMGRWWPELVTIG